MKTGSIFSRLNGRRKVLVSGRAKMAAIVGGYLFSLNKYLQRKTYGIRRGRLKVWFIALCTGFGVWNVWIVLRAFNKAPEFKVIDQIKIPGHVVQPSRRGRRSFSSGLKREMGWQAYIDSLDSTQAGRAMLDSMRQARPGLLDSITDLERRFDVLQ